MSSRHRRRFRPLAPYGVGSRLLSLLWALPPAQAWALRKLRRKNPDHPLYARRPADRRTLRRHLESGLFRDWREDALDRCSDRSIARHSSFEGVEHLEAARSEGRGLILAGSHYGAGQTLKILLPWFGLDLLTVGARAGRGPWRRAKVFWLTDIGDDALLLRSLVEARNVLRRGGAVQLPADGVVGKSGVEIGFLGRRRRFAHGFATLASTTRAPVVPVFAVLRAGGHVVVQFHPPLKPPDPALPRAERIESLLRQYAEVLERRWLEDPALVKPRDIQRFQQLPLDDSAPVPLALFEECPPQPPKST